MNNERKVTDRLLIIGDQMANLCFNLAQPRRDVTIEPRVREVMIECRRAWDAERLDCVKREKKPKPRARPTDR